MNDKLRNNKGFTLVELMISLGLMSIIMVAIFNFFLFNYRTYNRESDNAELQYHLQISMENIVNNIINAKGIYNKDSVVNPIMKDSDNIKKIIFERDTYGTPDINKKYYIIEHKSAIEIDGKIDKLFYTTTNSTTPESRSATTEFADYITYLRINPLDGDYSNCKGVEIIIKAEKGNSEMELNNKVYFRNYNRD